MRSNDGKYLEKRGIFKLDGTFDIPCRGGPLESKCTANKAIRE